MRSPTGKRRTFHTFIRFNYRTRFSPFKLLSSGPVSLCLPVEFQYVVRHMIGVPSILGEAAFGLDMRRVRNARFIMNVSMDHQCTQLCNNCVQVDAWTRSVLLLTQL